MSACTDDPNLYLTHAKRKTQKSIALAAAYGTSAVPSVQIADLVAEIKLAEIKSAKLSDYWTADFQQMYANKLKQDYAAFLLQLANAHHIL